MPAVCESDSPVRAATVQPRLNEKCHAAKGYCSRANPMKVERRTLLYKLGLRVLSIDHVCLGGHDEVVFVQVANLVRPPGDAHLAPFGSQPRMVAFLFRFVTDLVSESDGVFKILEFETTI